MGGGGVRERIRRWAEASMIYTLLSTEDTPPTVIHPAHTNGS